jgi:pyridoxal/pyridoxine/pyridoxamine kinase
VNINSVPTGTGDVTASVYIDGVLKWQKLVTSPGGYVYGASTNLVADNNVTIDEDVEIPVKASQAAIIRVGRATTATTGNISTTVK